VSKEYRSEDSNGRGEQDTQKAAARYIRAGLSVIPVPAGAKNPDRHGWQHERWTLEDVEDQWTNGQGIGILWGEPSGGLVDIDCDWPEARIAAGIILPREPRRTFGRPGSPESHHVVRVEGELPKTRRYKIGGQGNERSVVELLSTGTQSLAPPSLHESGERRRWYEEQSAPKMPGPEVQEAAADIVAAALLARNWPGKGSRHDYVLSASGFIGRRLPRERTQRIMEAAIGASGDEEARGRLADVRSTLDSLEAGRPTTGGPSLEDLAPGVVEQLQRWHRWGQGFRAGEAHEHSEAGGQFLPSIVVNDRPLRDVGDEALQALETRNSAATPKLFARTGRVIRLGQDENDAPMIEEASESVIRHHLTRAANFVRETHRKSGSEQTHVSPPRDVVQDVMSFPHLPFPPLIGVPRTPFFRPDGTVVKEAGYDAATRLYYVPTHEGFSVDVPDEPTDEQLAAAVKLLDEGLGDFPYSSDAAAANTLGLVLTPIMRNVIEGPTPLALVDKPTPGTGGSLLAEVVSLIATGSPAGMMSAPREDEECRKQITSALMRGNLVITLDNVDGVLHAPSLSRALTSEVWEDRILGRSEMIRVPQKASWIASGNNILVGGDLPRRCYWIRLDAHVERPWEREGFKHPELKPWVAQNRARLVQALLTLGRAWFAKGQPISDGAPKIGGFEGWSRTVGGVLEVAGISGFLGNLSEMYERAADGTSEWSEFLKAWQEAYGAAPKTTKQIAADLHSEKNELAPLRDALPEEFGAPAPDRPDKSLSRKLGNKFNKREGRRYAGGLHLARAGSKDRAVQWIVRVAPQGPPEGLSLMSLMSLSTPNVHASSRVKRESGPKQTQQTHRLISETDASCSEVDTSGSEASTNRGDFEQTSCEYLSAEQVGEELRRPNSGPSINLPLYLVGATTLEILTKSVLAAKDLKADAWEEHAGVVERAAADPRNHGVECECGECLP
jgi:Bifunctional DNA primase/polymerase, N-terminal